MYVHAHVGRFKRVEGNTNPDLDIPEPFALEAKYFVESRLLNREVQVICLCNFPIWAMCVFLCISPNTHV